MTDPIYISMFIGIKKEPEELKPEVQAGKVYIVSYPFRDLGHVDVFTYDPESAIKEILEDIGTQELIEFTTRKATLKDLHKIAGDVVL